MNLPFEICHHLSAFIPHLVILQTNIRTQSYTFNLLYTQACRPWTLTILTRTTTSLSLFTISPTAVMPSRDGSM